MIDFCSESWEKLSYLNLVECRLDDKKLKELLSNAKKFTELKILWICKLKLTQLKTISWKCRQKISFNFTTFQNFNLYILVHFQPI